jgi:acyl-CoA reductase-like NAD-dependent aldehyde dehydrogenase
METTPLRIAGDLVTTDEVIEIKSPYDGRAVGAVPLCGAAEVDRACRHAAEVLRRDVFLLRGRAEVLDKAWAVVGDRAEALARTITAESAKPITSARGEVARCRDTLAFAAAEARELTGEMIPMEASASGAGKLAFALRVPVGVVAAIAPFNFPLNLVAHKVAPAIAAGCPLVLKPAPQTPLTAIAFIELLIETGLPPDFISVLTDRGAEAAAPLVAHPIPKMITFTGSTAVGWDIAAKAPKKRVSLELGGAAPLILEPDADLGRVMKKLGGAAFGNAGQSCISVQRVLVHRSIHDEVLRGLIAIAGAVAVGDPEDPATVVGPLIRPRENDRIRAWIDEAVRAGATLETGGEVKDGVFLPTVVSGAPSDCRLVRDEVFGPVVVVQRYERFEEAVAMANDTALGLHVGVFTRDLGKALEAARQLDFGGVLINEVPTFRADQQPYGGVRDAGNTREGPAYATREMTDLKFVSLEG